MNGHNDDGRLLFWLPEEFSAFVSLVEPAAALPAAHGKRWEAALKTCAKSYTPMLLNISAKGFSLGLIKAGQPLDEDSSTEPDCLCPSSDTDDVTDDGETSANAQFSPGGWVDRPRRHSV